MFAALRPGPPLCDPPAVAQPRLRRRVHRHGRAGHRRQHRHLQRGARGDAEGAAVCRSRTAGRARPPHQRRRRPSTAPPRATSTTGCAAPTAFEAMAGFSPTERIVTVGDGAERIRGGLVRRAAVRGAGPPGGRGPGAHRRRRRSRGAAGGRAQRAAGAAAVRRPTSAVGQSLTINGDPHTVVGVMPRRLRVLRLRLRVLGAGAVRRGVPRQPRPVLPGRPRPAEARRRHRPGHDAARHGDGRHPPRLPAVHAERGGRASCR